MDFLAPIPFCGDVPIIKQVKHHGLRDWLSWMTDVTTLHGDWTGLLSFVSAALLSTFILLFLPSSSVWLSNFYLAVPMRGCLGKRSCMSSQLTIAILNGTCSLRALILFRGDVPAIKAKLNKQTLIIVGGGRRRRTVVSDGVTGRCKVSGQDFFLLVRCTSFHKSFSSSYFLFLYFIVLFQSCYSLVPMRKCLGKHSCMSSHFL